MLAKFAHTSGFAAGRVQGPAIFRFLLRRALRDEVLVPTENVNRWSPGRIDLDLHLQELHAGLIIGFIRRGT